MKYGDGMPIRAATKIKNQVKEQLRASGLQGAASQAAARWQNTTIGAVTGTYVSKLWQKINRFKPSTQIVMAIILVSSLWIISGHIFPHHPEELEKMHGKQFEYKMTNSKSVQYRELLQLAATTEAEKQIPLKVETDAKVISIIAHEGQFLKAGDPIIKLETQNKNETLARAEAALKQAQIGYQATNALYAKKLSSESDLAQSTAFLKNAEADYKQAQLNWRHTVVSAPFDGFIDKIMINVGDYMQTIQGNSIVGTFMAKDAVLAVAWVSEHDVQSLREGSSAEIQRADGLKMQGVVKFIAKIANPQTHTFRVDVRVVNDQSNPLLSGQTVMLSLPVKEVAAHQLPASALTLNMNGELGVKVINKDHVVSTIPVEIVGEEDGNMWLAGLPEEVEVVVLGHAYLLDGDKV